MFLIQDHHLRYETNLESEEILCIVQTGYEGCSIYHNTPKFCSMLHKNCERFLGPSCLVQRHAYNRSRWYDIHELLPLRPEALIVILSQTREEQEFRMLA